MAPLQKLGLELDTSFLQLKLGMKGLRDINKLIGF